MASTTRGEDDVTVTVVPWIGVVLLAGALVLARVRGQRRSHQHRAGLQVDELRRLHRAELAVAAAPSTYAAAKELAGHALALLDAPVAVVLIEGAEDTVRVVRGDADAASVYEPGSRMRLLDAGGTPVGSIAVGPRAEDRPYDERDEEILDALAQRVSATLQRLALFDAVQTERGALADVLDSSSDAIAAVGSDLRIESWNPAMARITGVPAEAALGQPCCAVFRAVAEDGAARHGASCPFRAGQAVEELLAFSGPAGERWLLTAFSPRASGGAVVVGRDVTARKQLDDEKGDFLATVSHELRTPLTPLKGFIQTLLRRGDEISGAERGHIYAILDREQARLERLVEQLLRATTTDQGLHEQITAFDWAAVVDQRVEAFQREDPSREVEVDLPPRPVGMLAAPDAALHILDELLSNAAKFAPPSATVAVKVEVAHGWVITTVEDAGAGVPEEDRERVFDRFVRLGDHLTRPQQGVGLGLYIVRRAVESMGGDVRCGVGELGGAALVVRLPSATLDPPAPTLSPFSRAADLLPIR